MTQYSPQISRAHEEPFAVQFSIFLANRVGQLKDLMNLFAKERIDVVGLSIVDSTDWAVIRTIFSDADRARELMGKHGLPFTESHVLLVELGNQQAMSSLCSHLLEAEINVHFAYPLIVHSDDSPVMVFHVDDHILATEVLTRHGFKILGYEDLSDPGRAT